MRVHALHRSARRGSYVGQVDVAVGCYLVFHFAVDIHVVEVVVANIGDFGAVGREGGEAEFAVFGDFDEGVVLDVVDVVVADAAVAVDGLEATAEEYLLLVVGELIAFDRGQRTSFLVHRGASEVANQAFAFAGFVGVFFDSVAGEDAVMLAVLHGADALYAAG